MQDPLGNSVAVSAPVPSQRFPDRQKLIAERLLVTKRSLETRMSTAVAAHHRLDAQHRPYRRATQRSLPATSLSGGQQQMAAIGRALMSNPKLLLCDEISLGLAPIIVRDIYARLPAIVADGLSLIVVEQDIVQALRAASHVYCLQEDRIALEGPAQGLTRERISAAKMTFG